MSLLLMKERIKQSGNSLYGEQIKNAQDSLFYGFKDDVSYSKYIFFWIGGENPHKGKHLDIKLYDRKYSTIHGNLMSFLTMNTDKIEVGDYIYDEKENTYWICTESFHVDNIHYEGQFTECNWYLKWQRKDGTILEYPCLDLNSTQYNSGEYSNKTLKIGSAQHVEKVQANSDTIALASPQRFYISRNNTIPFTITQNDTTASNYGKGICNITVTQDVNRKEDRPDLGICDYIEAPTHLPPSDKTTDLKIIISGEKNLRNSYKRIYTANFMDQNGNTINWRDIDFKWNIVSDFDLAKNEYENKIVLSIDNEDLIESYFLLRLLINDTVANEIRITITE